jgi:hypothetical protein
MLKTFIFFLLFCTFNLGHAWMIAPSSSAACVEKYASQIPEKRIADIVISSCFAYFNAQSSSDKKLYECAIEKVYKTKNITAAHVAFSECNDKYRQK